MEHLELGEVRIVAEQLDLLEPLLDEEAEECMRGMVRRAPIFRRK